MGTSAELIREWFDRVWNNNDSDFIDRGLAECCEVTGLSPEPIKTPADFHQFHTMINSIFRDLHVEVDRIMEDGDTCSGVITISAVHKPTNKPVQFQSSFFGNIRDNQICEVTNLVDYLSVLVQIGAIPGDVTEKGLMGQAIT